MSRIVLPNGGWRPRPYQMPLWTYLERGGKRAIEIAHRRWGKDDLILHRTAIAMHERPASYWHCLPEYAQARKALWAAVNPHTGIRRIDEAFPHDLRSSTNEQEMFIRFKNGATWQLVGSDRYNSLVGAGIAGVTFSEFALANPSAWGYIRPMLEENDGWATFITTPRGRNHAKALYDMAKKEMDAGGRWFAEVSSIHDTGALSPQQVEESLLEYVALYGEDIGRAQFEQEYLCSFNAAILGAFYAREIMAVRAEDRIDSTLDAAEGIPVHRAWDIGVKDDTSIWWFQVVGSQVYVLDCYSESGAGVDHYADVVERKRAEHGWIDGKDYVPHDARVKEWGTGRTRVETMQSLGLNPEVVPIAGKLDGINAVRQTLPRCVFHSRCEEQGIAALESYRREWDDDKKAFRQSEVHDWCFVGETEVVTRYGMCQIKSLPSQGEVLTPCGWKQYTNPRITRRNAPLVEVAFEDGLTVRCTPDHMFMTDSGWISAESLVKGSLIQSCLTPSHSISMALSTACTRVTDISRKAAQGFIEMFGGTPSALSLTGAISTTETMTPQTTRSRTWNASRLLTTCRKRFRVGADEDGGQSSTIPLGNGRPNGIGLRKGVFGISAMQSGPKAGRNGSVKTGPASTAKRYSRHWSVKGLLRSIAPKTARWRTIASVKELDYNQDVWCITVPGVEAFALSNGAVVHNCSHLADAFRYLAMTWRKEWAPTERKPQVFKPKMFGIGATLDDIIPPPIPTSRRRR